MWLQRDAHVRNSLHRCASSHNCVNSSSREKERERASMLFLTGAFLLYTSPDDHRSARHFHFNCRRESMLSAAFNWPIKATSLCQFLLFFFFFFSFLISSFSAFFQYIFPIPRLSRVPSRPHDESYDEMGNLLFLFSRASCNARVSERERERRRRRYRRFDPGI